MPFAIVDGGDLRTEQIAGFAGEVGGVRRVGDECDELRRVDFSLLGNLAGIASPAPPVGQAGGAASGPWAAVRHQSESGECGDADQRAGGCHGSQDSGGELVGNIAATAAQPLPWMEFR